MFGWVSGKSWDPCGRRFKNGQRLLEHLLLLSLPKVIGVASHRKRQRHFLGFRSKASEQVAWAQLCAPQSQLSTVHNDEGALEAAAKSGPIVPPAMKRLRVTIIQRCWFGHRR